MKTVREIFCLYIHIHKSLFPSHETYSTGAWTSEHSWILFCPWIDIRIHRPVVNIYLEWNFSFFSEVGPCYSNMAKNWFVPTAAVRKVLNSRGRTIGHSKLVQLCREENCESEKTELCQFCTQDAHRIPLPIQNNSACSREGIFQKANTLDMEFFCWLYPQVNPKASIFPNPCMVEHLKWARTSPPGTDSDLIGASLLQAASAYLYNYVI